MFDDAASPSTGCAVDDEAAFDWVSIERELRHGVEQTFGNIHPSGSWRWKWTPTPATRTGSRTRS